MAAVVAMKMLRALAQSHSRLRKRLGDGVDEVLMPGLSA
jgi:hypothetical protein